MCGLDFILIFFPSFVFPFISCDTSFSDWDVLGTNFKGPEESKFIFSINNLSLFLNFSLKIYNYSYALVTFPFSPVLMILRFSPIFVNA